MDKIWFEYTPREIIQLIIQQLSYVDIINLSSCSSLMIACFEKHAIWLYLCQTFFYLRGDVEKLAVDWKNEFFTRVSAYQKIIKAKGYIDPDDIEIGSFLDSSRKPNIGLIPCFNLRMPVENEFLVVQSTIPLLPLPIAGSNIGYYEVTIENFGTESSFCIGLAPKGFNRGVVGVGLFSVGIAADCTVYVEAPHGRIIGDVFSSGDCIGVGINFDTKQFFFTRNGEYMSAFYLPQLDSPDDRYYPSISMNSFDECLNINFGYEDWKFDILSHCIANKSTFIEYSKLEYPVFDLAQGQISISEECRKGYEDKLRVLDPIRIIYYHRGYLVEDYIIEELEKEEVNENIEARIRFIGSHYQTEESDNIKVYYESVLRHIEFILLDYYINIVNSVILESIELKRKRKFSVGELGHLYSQFQVLLTMSEDQIPFNNPMKLHMIKTDIANVYQRLTGELLDSTSVEQIFTGFMVYCRYLMMYHISLLKEGKTLPEYHPDYNHIFIRGAPVDWIKNGTFMKMINEYDKDECDVVEINRTIAASYGIVISPYEDMEEVKNCFIAIGNMMMNKSNEAEEGLTELMSKFLTQDTKTIEKESYLESDELKKESEFSLQVSSFIEKYQKEVQDFIDSIDPASEFYQETQTPSLDTEESDSYGVLKKIGLVLLGVGAVAAVGGLGYFLYKRSEDQ
eukprot:TRINITY_DN2383_c0_g1_i1.p1 TRINITY_DN2383_c0_g1~~TRINITY_DN2383_c0_g1_i1.p1  ORF type:complete len:696 (-),score=129.87 TRINITY_DN2383_c0_g1_i1:32-2077(-)